MFRIRETNYPTLAPLLLHCRPAKVGLPYAFTSTKGTLAELRDVYGHVVPQGGADMEVELLRQTYEPRKVAPIAVYLHDVQEMRLAASRSAYRDPYMRDTLEGPLTVLPYTPWETLEERALYDGAVARKLKKNKNAFKNMTGLETSSRNCYQIAASELTSKHAPPFVPSSDVYHDLGPGRKPGFTSDHLYKPKNPNLVSDWSVNLTMFAAKSRRSLVTQGKVTKCRRHDKHGDIVRMRMRELETEIAAQRIQKMFGDSAEPPAATDKKKRTSAKGNTNKG